jgi:poly(A) polymerase
MSLQSPLDDGIAKLREATLGTPYEGHVWLVGGAVRDALLGIQGGDLDFMVGSDTGLPANLNAPNLAKVLWDKRIADHPPVTFPRFGTAMIHITGCAVELATARTESYSKSSRKPDVRPATLLEDALRRDFTVNALYQNLHTGETTDPLEMGSQDLANRILRTPTDAHSTFAEDPLRMLRAVRFKWQLGMAYAPGLENAISTNAARLAIISTERIRDEFTKILLRPTGSEALNELLELKLLRQFAPELDALVGVEQGSFHHLKVWDHTLLVLRNLWLGADAPSLELVLAALFHDVAKPETRSVDAEGRTRFFSHEVVGAQTTRGTLRRLKYSNKEIEPVALLVKNHMRLGTADTLSSSAARRLLRDMGEELENLLRLVEADSKALRPGVRALDIAAIRERLKVVRAESPTEELKSPLTGEEIMQITGWGPGQKIGKLKAMLEEQVIEGSLLPHDREAARELCRLVSGSTDKSSDSVEGGDLP